MEGKCKRLVGPSLNGSRCLALRILITGLRMPILELLQMTEIDRKLLFVYYLKRSKLMYAFNFNFFHSLKNLSMSNSSAPLHADKKKKITMSNQLVK